MRNDNIFIRRYFFLIIVYYLTIQEEKQIYFEKSSEILWQKSPGIKTLETLYSDVIRNAVTLRIS